MSEAKTSSWVALQNPAFSKLWFATVTSGICVSAHDTAATWMMNSTSHSTLLLSLMSTASPAVGALASRFPGLEIDNPLSHALYLQKGIKSVNWLNCLEDR